jgi:hypothetical protein
MRARALRVAVATAGLVALSSLALADAPVDQYDLFTLDTQAIYDLHTKLTWQRYPPAVRVSYTDAANECATLFIAGFTGTWRLPSYKELLTLVDEQPHVEYENGGLVTKAIDGNAFPGATSGSYWTSSVIGPLGPTSVYGVNVGTGEGEPHSSASDTLLVRCVTP